MIRLETQLLLKTKLSLQTSTHTQKYKKICGSIEFSNQDLKQIGQGAHELWLDIKKEPLL